MYAQESNTSSGQERWERFVISTDFRRAVASFLGLDGAAPAYFLAVRESRGRSRAKRPSAMSSAVGLSLPDSAGLQSRRKAVDVAYSVHSSLDGLAEASPDSDAGSQCVYFIRLVPGELSHDNIEVQVVFGTLPLGGGLRHMQAHMRHVMLPLLRNKHNTLAWSRVVAKDVLNATVDFLGSVDISLANTEGSTLLPVPPEAEDVFFQKYRTSRTEGSHTTSEGVPQSPSPAETPPRHYASPPAGGGAHPPPPPRPDVPHLHKERVHQLEALVVTWSSQIKATMGCTPEDVIAEAASRSGADADALVGVGLVTGGGKGARVTGPATSALAQHPATAVGRAFTYSVLTTPPESFGRGIQPAALVSARPGPLLEVAYWQTRSAHLERLWQQLLGRTTRRVLAMLDSARSSHCSAFYRVVRELQAAKYETQDTLRYMRQLQPWLVRLEQAQDLHAAKATFTPIMHLLLLIWKFSQFYNVPSRLVLLVRLVVNAFMRHADRYLAPASMMKALAEGGAEEVHDALSTTLRVAAALKGAFFDYKARSARDVPDNPWLMQNSALWGHLDAFLERVHDLRDFSATVLQFRELDRLVIGGNKGASLSASVREIRASFLAAQEALCAVPYDVLDMTQTTFEEDFQAFRGDVRELETHLASVLTQAFDDCATTHAQLCLLQSFSLVSRRGVVKEAVEARYSAVLEGFSKDLLSVQAEFIYRRAAPPLPRNLPPTAGAVFWCRGLLLRVQSPMEMLRSLARDVLEREEARPVVRAFASLVTALGDFEASHLSEWGSAVEAVSSEELNKSLLRTVEVDARTGVPLGDVEASQDADATATGGGVEVSARSSVASGSGTAAGRRGAPPALGVQGASATVLKVNFSPDLVRLLREVKYFLLLGLTVPDAAGAVYRRAEQFRKHTSSLDLMARRTNDMLLNMLPVERPLMAPHLKQLSAALTKGMRALTWRSHGVDVFLNDAGSVVRSAADMMETLSSTLTSIQDIVETWRAEPLIVLPSKTAPLATFEGEWLATLPGKYALISEGGRSIIKLLRDALRRMHIASASPEWQMYIDFISQLVYSGLAGTVLSALRVMADGLDAGQLRDASAASPLGIALQVARHRGREGAGAASSLSSDIAFRPPLGVRLAATLSGDDVSSRLPGHQAVHGPAAVEVALEQAKVPTEDDIQADMWDDALTLEEEGSSAEGTAGEEVDAAPVTVRSRLLRWVDAILKVAGLFNRVDTAFAPSAGRAGQAARAGETGGRSTYARDVIMSMEVQSVMSVIEVHVRDAEVRARALHKRLTAFGPLINDDPNAVFLAFLRARAFMLVEDCVPSQAPAGLDAGAQRADTHFTVAEPRLASQYSSQANLSHDLGVEGSEWEDSDTLPHVADARVLYPSSPEFAHTDTCGNRLLPVLLLGATVPAESNDARAIATALHVAKERGLRDFTLLLNLRSFGEELVRLRDLQMDITGMPDSYAVGFLRVDAAPLKQALSARLARWTHMYTSYLESFLLRRLQYVHCLCLASETSLEPAYVESEASVEASLAPVSYNPATGRLTQGDSSPRSRDAPTTETPPRFTRQAKDDGIEDPEGQTTLAAALTVVSELKHAAGEDGTVAMVEGRPLTLYHPVIAGLLMGGYRVLEGSIEPVRVPITTEGRHAFLLFVVSRLRALIQLQPAVAATLAFLDDVVVVLQWTGVIASASGGANSKQGPRGAAAGGALSGVPAGDTRDPLELYIPLSRHGERGASAATPQSGAMGVDEVTIAGRRLLQYLQTARMSWHATVNLTFKMREVWHQDISSLADHVRHKCAAFDRSVATFRSTVAQGAPFHIDTGAFSKAASAMLSGRDAKALSALGLGVSMPHRLPQSALEVFLAVNAAYADLDELYAHLLTLRREARRLAVLEAVMRTPASGGRGGRTQPSGSASVASLPTVATETSGREASTLADDGGVASPSRGGRRAGSAVATLAVVDEVHEQLVMLKAAWDAVGMVHSTFTSWRQIPWKDVNAEALGDACKGLQTALAAFPPVARGWPLHRWAADQCSQMAGLLPLVQDLRSPAVRPRHWAFLMRLTGAAVGQGDVAAAEGTGGGEGGMLGPGFRLGDVLDMRLHTAAEAVSEVVEQAAAEGKVERRLAKVEMTWNAALLTFVPYASGRNQGEEQLYWLSSPDSLLDDVDEHLMVLQSTLASVSAAAEDTDSSTEVGRWTADFKQRLERWLSMLGDIDATLRLWVDVQRLWSSMEGIFLGSADVRSALPEDIKRFEVADAEFKELLREGADESRVVVACVGQARIDHLQGLHEALEVCQRALSEYLELKKKAFPRFYFVSDAALLDMLAHGTNPPRVAEHIGDCFPGVSRLQLEVSTAAAREAARDAAAARAATGKAEAPPSVVPDEALAVVASDGEVLPFLQPADVRHAVEVWLAGLEDSMREAMMSALGDALEGAALWSTEQPRERWVHEHLSQPGLLASLVMWTEETEAALEELEGGIEEALPQHEARCSSRLQALVREVLSPSLSAAARRKLVTMITIDVHSRDVVTSLIENGVSSTSDFDWKAQLRFYHHPTSAPIRSGPVSLAGQTCARISDFRTAVCHEFLGNAGRLVITPLTDRCYITLATALTLYLGGAPAGPAGTGKTETVKDLGKALGIPVYVFNCSDQMTHRTLADIFKGLAQTGAWGCFDEFNRIHVSVLSVVATQVSTLLGATRLLLGGKLALHSPADASVEVGGGVQGPHETQVVDADTQVWRALGRLPRSLGDFDFEGDTIRLVPTTGVFITMNPGYAGRTELPENLKALFRSCAMIVPDMALICENMMFAYGFSAARSLSVKFVTLYSLSKELLSPQAHYDWGLRAAKAVLMVAGRLKQGQVTPADEGGPVGGLLPIASPLAKLGRKQEGRAAEEALLLRALRDFNMPKIVPADAPIFLRLVSDVFPGVDVPTEVDDDLRSTAAAVCKAQGLQPEESFLAKVEQLQQLMEVRHSVMLLGGAGTGKSTVWATLAAALNVAAGHEAVAAARQAAAEAAVEAAADGVPGEADPDAWHEHLSQDVRVEGGLPTRRVVGFEVVNPKAVTPQELYGQTSLTKEWQDGVLSVIFRNMAEEETPYGPNLQHRWIVLDGDIDAMWIESMNTVMDDNKTLTLVSNERIPLTDSMRLVFEMDSLRNATPATVSRAGIIHLHEGTVGWRAMVESWVADRPLTHEERSVLLSLFEEYVERILGILDIGSLKHVAPQTPLSMVACHCSILGGLLDDPACATGSVRMRLGRGDSFGPGTVGLASLPPLDGLASPSPGTEDAITTVLTHTREMLEALFFFSAVWAFGGAVGNELAASVEGGGASGVRRGAGANNGRARFSKMFKSLTKASSVQFPQEELEGTSVFDFWFTATHPGAGGSEAGSGRGDRPALLEGGGSTFTAGEGVSMHTWSSLLPKPLPSIAMSLDGVIGLRGEEADAAGMVATLYGGVDGVASRLAEDGLQAITVPTTSGMRVSALMHMLRCRGVPVMLVGTQGTGKSTLVHEYLQRASQGKAKGGAKARGVGGPGGRGDASGRGRTEGLPSSWVLGGGVPAARCTAHSRAGVSSSGQPILHKPERGGAVGGPGTAPAVTWRPVPLSYYTDAAILQSQLEEHLDRRSGKVYGPSSAVTSGSQGKTLVYFVDDVNMPAAEEYGTQTPIELLRSLLDHGGWYDRTNRSLRRTIVDTAVFAAMNPTAGSFSISSRLQRHFATFAVPMPGDSDLRSVFAGVLASRLVAGKFAGSVLAIAGALVAATLELRATAALRFLPSSVNFHYQWNLREVEGVVQGLCRAQPLAVRKPLTVDILGVPPPPGSSRGTAFDTPQEMVALWVHECRRVFRDRLTSAKDEEKFNNILLEVLRRHFDVEASEVCSMPSSRAAALRGPGEASTSSEDGDAETDEALFACFTSQGAHDDPTYLPVSDMQTYTQLLQHIQREHNAALASAPSSASGASALSLVLFRDAAYHVVRLARVLSSPAGHVLLVGVGGSGKQSLTRLAAFAVNQGVVPLAAAAAAAGGGDGGAFGLQEVHEVLKDTIRKVAVKPGEPHTLLVTDGALLEERFLTCLNDLMVTGDVPNLHSTEELDALYTGLRADAKLAGVGADDRNGMQRVLLQKVRRGLHVVLAMSPVGDALRTRARRFPAVAGATTVNWLNPWPVEALVSVSTQMLAAGTVNLGSEGAGGISLDLAGLPSFLTPRAQGMLTPSIAAAPAADSPAGQAGALPQHLSDPSWIRTSLVPVLAKHMAEVHALATAENARYARVHRRYNYATPKSFLEFIAAFQRIVERKRGELGRDTGRLVHGLDVLARTQRDVDDMQEQLRVKMVTVQQRREVADKLLTEVTAESELAASQAALAEEEQAKADGAAAAAAEAEASATEELKRAEPALAAAKHAVNCLSKSSMAELKSMQRPPDIVALVMRAVLTLLGETKSFTWELAVRAMGNVPQFKKRLEGTDGRRIPEVVINRVGPILAHREFDPPAIIRRSNAAGNLATWVDNLVTYNRIFKEVEPLMHAKAAAEAEKKRADAALAGAMRDLARAEARVAELNDRLKAATADKEAAEAEAQTVQDRLGLAQRLVHGLSGEKVRWTGEVASAADTDARLVGQCVLAAAFVSYCGGFDTETRQALHGQWVADLAGREVIPLPPKPDFVGTLSTDAGRAAWANQGLPTDRTSVENAAIVTEALRGRWPLLVDPQLQGLRWLKGLEAAGLAAPTDIEAAAKAAAASAELSSGAAAAAAMRARAGGSPSTASARQPAPRRCVLLSLSPSTAQAVGDGAGGDMFLTGRGRSTGGAGGMLAQLQTAVKEGWSVVLCDVPTTLPPMLRPLVERSVFVRRGSAGGAENTLIRLGGAVIKFHPQFKLYLQTRAAAPHFAPEVQAQCTLVNFTVTQGGLESQLLGDVVRRERPEIEAKARRLAADFASYRIQLSDLEEDVLSRLSSAEPESVLGDVELIEGLERTKVTVAEIEAAVQAGEETQRELDAAREVFRDIAAEGTRLYFACVALGSVSAMYQFSLAAFKRFFMKAVDRIPLGLSGRAAVYGMLTGALGMDADLAGAPAPHALEAAAESSGEAAGGRGKSSAPSAEVEAGLPRTRSVALQLSVRQTLFSFIRRGLLSHHRLVFLTQLLLQLLAAGAVPGDMGYTPEAASFLLRGRVGGSSPSMSAAVEPATYVPPEVEAWMQPRAWGAVSTLSEAVPAFAVLPADIIANSPRFRDWAAHSAPEGERLPMEWKDLDHKAPFLKLCLVRALRPDRLPAAITAFVRKQLPLGRQLADADAGLSSAAILQRAFQDASPTAPVYFILSAGADVDTDVAKLADASGAAGEDTPDVLTVSLGQGQEGHAEAALTDAVLSGKWVLLNNVHLMPQWLRRLGVFMENVDELEGVGDGDSSDDEGEVGADEEEGGATSLGMAKRVHPNFRLLLSSDPSESIPHNLLSRCITLTSEPPSGLQVNLRRAFTSLPKAAFDAMDIRTRSIFFGLSFFHAIMIERRKFGPVGFNRSYPFGEQDLAACTTVLQQQMEAASSVPWASLRYIFGEILYGGHITDAWDRRCSNAYLAHFMQDSLLGDMELFPHVPPDAGPAAARNSLRMPSSSTWEAFVQLVDESEALAVDTPRAFGMHPNADVAFFTGISEDLLASLQRIMPDNDVEGGVGAAPGVGEGRASAVQATVQELLTELGELMLPVADVRASLMEDVEAAPGSPRAGGDSAGTLTVSPFATVFLQECDSCNYLLSTMLTGLHELMAGMRGELTMGDALEAMQTAIATDRVPAAWAAAAYPSNRPLAAWLLDVQARHKQLAEWCDMPAGIPPVTWLAGLFHPQSFLTAVLQTQAQLDGAALDSLAIATEVTDMPDAGSVMAHPPDGTYVSGLFLQNARWGAAEGSLLEPAPRALFAPLPVLHITAVGRGKEVVGGGATRAPLPVYRTETRGPTYVFTAHLRTPEYVPEKWVLAGAACVMEVVQV